MVVNCAREWLKFMMVVYNRQLCLLASLLMILNTVIMATTVPIRCGNGNAAVNMFPKSSACFAIVIIRFIKLKIPSMIFCIIISLLFLS